MDDEQDDEMQNWMKRKDDPNLSFTEILSSPNLPENLVDAAYKRALPGNPELAEVAAKGISAGLQAIVAGFKSGDFDSDKMNDVVTLFVENLRQLGPTFMRSATFGLAGFYGDCVRMWMLMRGWDTTDLDVGFNAEEAGGDAAKLITARVLVAATANHAQDAHSLLFTTDDVDVLADVFLLILSNLWNVYEDGAPAIMHYGMRRRANIPDDPSSLLDGK